MTRALQNHGRPGCLLMAVLLAIVAGCGLALADGGPRDILRERFDELEVNHFHDMETGKLILSQWLFRNFKPNGALRIDAFRIAKGQQPYRESFTMPTGESITIMHGLPRSEATPRFNHQLEMWELVFFDGDRLRCIEARTLSRGPHCGGVLPPRRALGCR